jgi:hypothetical protein
VLKRYLRPVEDIVATCESLARKTKSPEIRRIAELLFEVHDRAEDGLNDMQNRIDEVCEKTEKPARRKSKKSPAGSIKSNRPRKTTKGKERTTGPPKP